MNVTLDRVEIKKNAKKLLDGKTWFMFLCNFIFLLIVVAVGACVYLIPNPLEKLLTNFVYGYVPEIDLVYFQIDMEWICWGIYIFFRTIIFAALTYPFFICLSTIPLAVVRGEKITVQSIFKPISRARYFLEYAIAGIERFITTFLWTLLAIVPGFIAHYKYSFNRYIFADDNEKTAGEALARSKKYAVENRGSLFALDLSFIGWAIISIGTCGLGFIFAVSYHEISYASYYETIRKAIDSSSEEKSESQESERQSENETAEKSEGPVGTRFEPTDSDSKE